MNSEKIYNHYIAKQYHEATVEGLLINNSIPLQFRNGTHFGNYFISMEYALLSAYEAGYYIDCCIFGNNIFSIVAPDDTNIPCGNQNCIALLERYLEASIFCLVEKACNVKYEPEEIIKILENRYLFEKMQPNSLFVSLKKLYLEFADGKYPYYVIECSIPFHIPAADGEYEIKAIPGVRSINVVKVTHNKGTEYELHYTRFKVLINGMIKASGDWEGPSSKNKQSIYNTRKAIAFINEFLLIMSKIDNCIYYPRVHAEYVETHINTQHHYSGEIFHYANYTNFGVGGISTSNRSKSFTTDQQQALYTLLLSVNPLPLYEKLLILAQNDISVGMYTEAFMLLSSAFEALIYEKTRHLATKFNVHDAFEKFETLASRCDSCEVVIANNAMPNEKAPVLPPSVFKYMDFLRDHGIIESHTCKMLKAKIASARNDQVRNEVMHGKLDFVNIDVVKKTLGAIEDIKNLLNVSLD